MANKGIGVNLRLEQGLYNKVKAIADQVKPAPVPDTVPTFNNCIPSKPIPIPDTSSVLGSSTHNGRSMPQLKSTHVEPSPIEDKSTYAAWSSDTVVSITAIITAMNKMKGCEFCFAKMVATKELKKYQVKGGK